MPPEWTCVPPLPVGMACSDHPEWVLPTTWTVAAGRPALEVVLSTPDDMEIRPYTGGFVAMVGDGTSGHPDWPHIGVALMRPLSRGRVTLVSADPLVPPIIEHRYDSEPADIAALRAGCEVAREIAGADNRSRRAGMVDVAASVRYRPDGSRRRPGAPLSTTSAACTVSTDLWVIDGSVLPTITRRGPHATIAMLGHRAAEFVG